MTIFKKIYFLSLNLYFSTAVLQPKLPETSSFNDFQELHKKNISFQDFPQTKNSKPIDSSQTKFSKMIDPGLRNNTRESRILHGDNLETNRITFPKSSGKKVDTFLRDRNINRAIQRDTRGPRIDVLRTTECGDEFLQRSRCDQKNWSAHIKITDEEAGLLSVTTDPPSPVPQFRPGAPKFEFFYNSLCCNLDVRVIATDFGSNSNYLDLNNGTLIPAIPIYAIVLIVILILLLIAFLIALILWLVRRKAKPRRGSVVLTRRLSRS